VGAEPLEVFGTAGEFSGNSVGATSLQANYFNVINQMLPCWTARVK
jgi:hypothetical protein